MFSRIPQDPFAYPRLMTTALDYPSFCETSENSRLLTVQQDKRECVSWNQKIHLYDQNIHLTPS
jgi:hypothetical protein